MVMYFIKSKLESEAKLYCLFHGRQKKKMFDADPTIQNF